MTARQELSGGPAQPPCLWATFAGAAAASPGAVAIVDGDREIGYAELVGWIARCAALLAERGIGAGDRVAVSGPRCAAVVAAMWATLAVGATYVPLDVEYPAQRLEHMLGDSGAALVWHAGGEPGFAGDRPTLAIPEPAGTPATPVAVPPAVECAPERPVYMIYTSGSTGRPKGVELPHRCVDGMADWQCHHSMRPDLRTAQFAPLNFDVWFQEVLGTLCGGGTLVIMPENLRGDAIALLDWLAEHRVERLFLPCVALHMVTIAAADLDSLEHLALREINTAGEQLVCTPAVRDFFRRLPDCRLNNHYGQSESAMVTVHTLTGPSDSWPALPPIGRPLPGCEVLIDVRDPAEPFVGELLVAGLPLSPGYHNQPELTARRYVTVPATATGNTRAFRTGDLVRVQDGLVHFLGRTDHELKIRGYRVNPLEVDACLVTRPEVVDGVCVAVEIAPGSRHLRAAVTVADDQKFDEDRILAALRELLPAQLVPLSVTPLPELPRTPSGKVDRRAVADLLATQARGRE